MKQKGLICTIILTSLLLGISTPSISALENHASSTAETAVTSQEEVQNSGAQQTVTEVASSTGTSTEAIIGGDDQYKVTDTTAYPYNSIVHLELHFNQGIADGTGVLIAPDLVLTVAHNVFFRSAGEWANEIIVTPGKDGDTAPYGSFTGTHFYMFRNYPTTRGIERRENDVAIIKLNSPVPSTIGFLPLATELAETERLQVAGYPADTETKFGSMYTAFGTIAGLTDKTVTHLVDTERGNSGSPILNSSSQIVGLHSSALYDNVTPTSGTENYGRRITQEVLDMIEIARTNGALTDTVTSNIVPTILPTGVSLNPTNKTLTVGETVDLTATVSPSNATDPSVTWETSDPAVATVVNGLVTAVGPGTATITVKTVAGNQSATAQIVVNAPAPAVTTEVLYRMYNPGLKVHLYTKDADEYRVLATRGWQQEGEAWTTASNQGESVYRLYNPGLKVHLYTKDADEYRVLATRGWQQEGIAFYAVQ